MRLHVTFLGEVECRQAASASVLSLSGRAEDGPAHLTLLGRALPVLPSRLAGGVRVEELDASRYRISSQAGEWTFAPARAYLHRDLSGALASAIPPRPVRWRARLIWRLALGAAGTRLGRRWLAR